MSQGLALLEIGNLAPSLLVADRCVKGAGVSLVGVENSDSGALCLKLVGPAAAVALAVQEGVRLARLMKASVEATVLPGPLSETMELVQQPPAFVPLLGVYDSLAPREDAMMTPPALGLLETQGLSAVLHATDEMLKTSTVSVVGKEKIGGGFVTILIAGDLSDVQTAIEAGRRTVERLGGTLILADVVSNPHPDLASLLPAT